MKCNFSKINSSFCGGTITLYTVCAMCSDTVHFMQFTGLACGLIVPSSIITHKITKIRALYRQFSTNARIYGHAWLGALDCTYNDRQDHQNTAPTWNGDLNLSKWGPNGDLILSEMGTKWGPSAAEMGTKWGLNGDLKSVYLINWPKRANLLK